ncbi:Glycosyltransferase involved in cell wall bisynthesis [Rhodococcus pyridinivorans]|uniref:glycosyltransferase n=1 Tax=Rhodococcus pyridinivorans TaxID=103816 RepID=UPI0008983DE7|nr:glycosyltransferase [Rhodococcus pyridinivorans]QXF82807.1 glycosyltransferase [Rhodococcus pyridinivorans]SEC26867.1 Glycosyltransferase involved in cell wall bisynthesis [Rhodococcus pyridinivorans]
MRVAIVVSSETRGGAEQYLYRLYSELRRTKNVEPILVGRLPDWSDNIGTSHAAGVTDKMTRRRPLASQAFSAVRSVRDIAQCVNSIKPDIVHIQFFKEKLLLPRMFKIMGYPVVWTEHSPLPTNFPPGGITLLRRQAKHANVISISRAVTASLDSAGIASALIENPLPAVGNAQEVRDAASPRSSPQVLYVGRLHKNKRVDLVVEAARMLPHVQFGIVGEGPEYHALRIRAGENVTFYGNVDDVGRLYNQCKIVVLPSGQAAREGAPMVMLEARVAGAHVLMANDCHAIQEAISLGCKAFDPVPTSLVDMIQGHLDSPRTEISPDIVKERSPEVWAHRHYEFFSRISG